MTRNIGTVRNKFMPVEESWVGFQAFLNPRTQTKKEQKSDLLEFKKDNKFLLVFPYSISSLKDDMKLTDRMINTCFHLIRNGML